MSRRSTSSSRRVSVGVTRRPPRIKRRKPAPKPLSPRCARDRRRLEFGDFVQFMTAAETRWRRVNDLFHAELVRTPAERDAFLAGECGQDVPLRLEVQSLLAAHLTTGSVASASVSPGTRLGDYQVTSFIAAGAMGQVYRARDTKLGRDVALKILPPTVVGDPDRHARFEREARVLASLNHPNIATIYGFVESGGISALALELVDGETLADRIARGKIPVNETLRIAQEQ